MLYGVAQAGYNGPPNQGKNLTSIIPGDSYTLFDGTETLADSLTSVAVNRGTSPGFTDNGITFYMTGATTGTHVDIQGSNIDADADYLTLATLNGDASGGNDAYTDVGRAAFYRAKVSASGGGAMPIVTTQR